MGRRSLSRALEIWTNDRHVGRWVIPSSGPMELRYDTEWVASDEGRPLSLSLPFNLDGVALTGDKVASFFDNLLPDNDTMRRRIRARFHTKTDDTFDLLEAIGRDCVGAVQLLPENEKPSTRIALETLDSAGVEKMLLRAVTDPSAYDDDDDFRISIAGAQEKTALTWHDGSWCNPHGATPTTHIFKLPLGLVGGRRLDMRESLENEWLCAQLLEGFGVPVAKCEVKKFGATKALVVTRFDRTRSKRSWLRLPQEDFCQATGTPSARKYESDGGPGIVDIARILRGSESRDADLDTLLRAQLLFWMLAATDGHAKNFSLRIHAGGRYQLTPLYDVISAWPITGSRSDQVHPKKLRLAMAVTSTHKHYRLSEIARRHFDTMAQKCGFSADMRTIIDDVVTQTPTVIDDVAARLPKAFPESLFESVTTGLRKAAKQL
jgi:serine/threonine-protein kinase HipA